MKNEWELIGHAAVDSGQLLLVDPAYIDSHWQRREFQDIRIYEHKLTGARLQYRVDFGNYQDPLEQYGGQTMNELRETGEWEGVPIDVEPTLDYNGICHLTLGKDRGGQVDLGVAFSTGGGDGNYPVCVKRDKYGRIMQVWIDFRELEEGEEEE